MKALRFFILSIIVSGAFSVSSGQNIETVVQAGHYGEVTASAYNSDGTIAATGSSDKTIILWRAADGRQIRTLSGSPSGVTSLSFSNDGSKIVSLGEDGSVTIWNPETGALLKSFKPDQDRYSCVAISPDGKEIVAGTRKAWISVINIETGNVTKELKPIPAKIYNENLHDYPGFGSVTWSTDGKYIIAGASDNTAILFNAITGTEIRKFKKTFSTCTSCYIEASLSPDNSNVFIAMSDSVKMFNAVTGAIVAEFYGQGGTPEKLSVSPDGKYIAAIEYGVAEVWDIKSQKLILKTGDYSDNKVLTASFSPDSKNLLTGNEKRVSAVYSIPAGSEILKLRGYLNQVDESIITNSYMYWAALVNEAELSPDGKYIAVGRTGNNAKIIDFRTGKVFRTLRGHNAMVISLAFSNDGKYLATGGVDGKAIVWDMESGKAIRTISFPDQKLAIFSVDISSDNKMLATADWGGYVIIWDIESGEAIKSVSPHDRTGVYQVKFSQNGVYFISAGLDRKLKMTEIDTGEEIRLFTGHTDLVNSINLSPDGSRIITAGWDGTVRVWDFMSGIQLLKIKAHNGGVYNAKYDNAGKFIVSGGDDFMVRQWDASTGKMVSELAGHQGGVGDVNLTSDQKYIISGSRDGSVRVWDVAQKREIVAITFLNEDDWFIKSPEGYFDASEGAFNSISFVKGTQIYSVSQFFNEFYKPGLYTELMGSNNAAFRQNVFQAIEKSPPPSIEIMLPEDGKTTDTPASAFMVQVTNNGGGVKELRVMHNGKRQVLPDDDLRKMTRAGQTLMKTFDLNLVPGENLVSVSAYSNGDIESESSTVNVTYNGLQRSSDLYILSIGINKYTNENLNLTYARPDAEAFSAFVKSKSSKLFNKVHSFQLTDQLATREKILSTLAEITTTMKKEDVFLFFYAGHGSTEGNTFYFITSEISALYQADKLKNALTVNELQERFKALPALKQVLFVDACYSGGSVEVLAMRGATEEKALAQLSRSSGVHVMASSEVDQQSAEIKSLGHGVFTYVLLEALNGKADGAPADSKITVYEIKSYIDDQVPEVSFNLIRHKQFPSTFSIGHDFPIVMD